METADLPNTMVEGTRLSREELLQVKITFCYTPKAFQNLSEPFMVDTRYISSPYSSLDKLHIGKTQSKECNR